MKYIGKLQLLNTGKYRFNKPIDIFIFRDKLNLYYFINKFLSIHKEYYDFNFALSCIYEDLNFLIDGLVFEHDSSNDCISDITEYLKGLLK